MEGGRKYMNIGEPLPGEPEIYAAVFRFKRSAAERSRKTREYRTAARIKNQAHNGRSYPGSRRYTQRFSVLSGAQRSGHGKRANIERRQGEKSIRIKYKITGRQDHQRTGISRRVFRFSEAVTENERDRPGLGGHWVVVVGGCSVM